MKFKYFIITVLGIGMIFCNAKPLIDLNIFDSKIPDEIDDHKTSRLLIDRFNKIRKLNNIESIAHDTILDDLCKTIIRNSKYKNAKNVFIEDSIRHLLYSNGIIDYQYDIIEASDKDTTKVFNSFLVTDHSPNIRLGYNKYGNRNIFIKTRSYLKFDHWLISTRSNAINMLDNNSEADIQMDSAICFFKSPIQGKYFYQFYDRIPLNSDKLSNVKLFEVNTGVATENEGKIMYDLKIKSTDPNAFLIISNSLNEKIAIVK